MSWTNLMKMRLIEIGLFAGTSIGLSYYVGGVGLATIFFSALFLWLVFSVYDLFPTSSRYLASLVVSTVIPVLTVVAFIRPMGNVKWLRHIVFTPPSSTPTDYIAISSTTLGTTKQWVLFVITGAIICMFSMLIALRDRRSRKSTRCRSLGISNEPFSTRILQNSFPAISRYVVLIPLIALSYLQSLNQAKSLAFMMSGDSRNTFRLIMRTRVTSTYPSIVELFQNGRYGETLATSISVMNGTKGYPRIADIAAMRSVYITIYCLIVAGISVLFTVKSEKWIPLVTPLRNITIIVISVLVMYSPYPFTEIFRSGFFSFFVALGYLTATVALLIPERIQRPEVLLLLYLAALATFLSYQPAVLIVAPLLIVLSARFMWQCFRSKIAHDLIILSLLLLALVIYLTYQTMYQRLMLRVGTSGEIWPTNENFTLFALLMSGALSLISRGDLRRVVLSSTAISTAAVLTLRLIDFARGQDLDMYYLMKLRYATNFVSGILCIAVIAAIFNEPSVWNFQKVTKALVKKASPVIRVIVLLGLVSSLVISVSNRTQASSPVAMIKSGWDAPSASVVEKTFALWEVETPYIIVGYFNDGNDRIANFWSPYFWEYNRWYWTYSGYSVSTEALCNIVSTNNVVIYTKSLGLDIQMAESCPEVSRRTLFRSRENQIFDFSS